MIPTVEILWWVTIINKLDEKSSGYIMILFRKIIMILYVKKYVTTLVVTTIN